MKSIAVPKLVIIIDKYFCTTLNWITMTFVNKIYSTGKLFLHLKTSIDNILLTSRFWERNMALLPEQIIYEKKYSFNAKP